MSIDIKVPSLGESVTEATIARWYKNVGDSVAIDEPLLELETDKVTLEVPAPATGQLNDIKVNDGDTVEVGTILGTIIEGAATLVEKKVEAPIKKEVVIEKPIVEVSEPIEAPKIEINKVSEVSSELSPAVRKIVAENNIDINEISPSGKNGRITKEDALNSLSNQSSKTEINKSSISVGNDKLTERVTMSRLRKTIAKRLKDAQNTAAILTLSLIHISEPTRPY